MANIKMNQSKNVMVKVTDILKKLRTSQDSKYFALENSKKKNII